MSHNAVPMDIGARTRRFYDDSVLQEVPEPQPSTADAPVGLAALTPREVEVLALISGGLTNAEAARRLHVSVHAIKFHLAAVYSRLGVANRTEAAVTYLRFMDRTLQPNPQADSNSH